MSPGESALNLVLGLHLASTLIMVGVIWYVQLVHYPLMSRVPPVRFLEFHQQHGRRTGWVVVGPMVVEALTAGLLVLPAFPGLPTPAAFAGLALVVLIWLSTFGVQVPLHRRLSAGFDPSAHLRLVRTNWLRTVAWSVRGALVVVITT